MSNPNQLVQDDTIRLIVLVDCEIHTLIWITNPVPAPKIGTEEADLHSYTGWYYDEEDIPFFCGDSAQAAAYMLRKELGKRSK